MANETKACACVGGTMGVQTCSADGSGYSICQGCEGGSSSSSSSGNTSSSGSSSSSGNPNMDCGNGKPDPGECGPEGTCPVDCTLCGNGVEDPGECPPGMPPICAVDCNPCKDHITFAGFAPMMSGPIWTYAGVTGIDAGNNMCLAIGADHICTAKELRDADAHVDPVTMKNEFATKSVAAGTTAWLHREDTDMVDVGGVMTPGGAGARCNDWKYGTNHISDGEYVDWVANDGKPSFHYDNDPIFDGANPGIHTQPGVLDCGGVTRNISCCFSACKP